MLIYSTPPMFSARFEVFGEDNYDGPYQVRAGHKVVYKEGLAVRELVYLGVS